MRGRGEPASRGQNKSIAPEANYWILVFLLLAGNLEQRPADLRWIPVMGRYKWMPYGSIIVIAIDILQAESFNFRRR